MKPGVPEYRSHGVLGRKNIELGNELPSSEKIHHSSTPLFCYPIEKE
jgi:hypothetical protein